MFALKLLVLLLLACTTIASAGISSNLPKGYDYYEDIDTAYRISTSRVNWTTAKQRCCSQGAHLAVIDTWTKIEYIKESTSLFEWVWVGIHRDSIRDEWRDALGDWTASNLPWATMNPKPIGKCVSVSGLVAGLSNWPCDWLFNYVCEISGQYGTDAYSAECSTESSAGSSTESSSEHSPESSTDSPSESSAGESSGEHALESLTESSTEDQAVLPSKKRRVTKVACVS